MKNQYGANFIFILSQPTLLMFWAFITGVIGFYFKETRDRMDIIIAILFICLTYVECKNILSDVNL